MKTLGSAKCEFCGEPAHYWWAPRKHPARMMAMCKKDGESIAGNFTDELMLILLQDNSEP